jgi:hypothetical protein
MKKLSFYIVGLLFTIAMNGQVTVGAHFAPPVWAPKAPPTVKYYYLPDIETYYDVPAKNYIYLSNGTWVRTTVLPASYKEYNLANSHPVYLTDYRGNTPYVLYKEHKVKYKKNGWKRNGNDNGLHKGQNKGKGKGNK